MSRTARTATIGRSSNELNNAKLDKAMSEKKREQGTGIAIGLALGLCYGLIFDNLAIGLCIGVALGTGMDSYNKRKNNKEQ